MNLFFQDFSNEKETFSLFNSEMDFIIRNLCSHTDRCYENLSNGVLVAVSGGSDSLSLLILMRNWCNLHSIPLMCVTVDHKLRSESRKEAEFVADLCRDLKIQHTILEWNRISENIPEGKIENLAREARYSLISNFCSENAINIVAVGHTWNDQLETFEMRKLSKSSKIGLAGMSRIRSLSEGIVLIRPIMHFSREYLKDFLRNKNIHWKNDPMNNDEKFKRVICRKNILSFDKATFLAKTSEIKLLGEKRNKIETQAVRFLRENINFDNLKFGYAVFDLQKFLQEKSEIQSEILRRAIWNIGGNKYAPQINESVLKNIRSNNSNSGVIATVGKCILKIAQKRLLIVRENRNLNEVTNVSQSGIYIFDNRFSISIKFSEDYYFHNELTKCMILSYGNFLRIHPEKIKKSEEVNLSKIPSEVLVSIPCVCINEQPVFIFEVNKLQKKINELITIKCEFVSKACLFDIFL